MFERSASHILLFAANPADVEFLQRELLKIDTGMVLDIARDGRDARAYQNIWDEGSPTPMLILIDLQTDAPTGLNILRNLKSHPRYRALPVVMLTASNDSADIQTSYSLKANSCVLRQADLERFAADLRLIHRLWCELNVRPEG